MKHYFVLLFFPLLVSPNLSAQTTAKHKYKLTHVGNVTISIPSAIELGYPVNVCVLSDGNILWGEKNRFLLFKKGPNGTYRIEKFNKKGSGPGEIEKATRYVASTDLNRFAIWDRGLQKFSVYNLPTSHVYDVPVQNASSKLFVTLKNHLIASFNDPGQGKQNFAVSVYNKHGNIVHQWGKIPYYAKLQEYRDGGGITKDDKGNIYYSYLGGYKIWKIDPKTNKVSVFSDKPAYFDEANRDKLKRADNNQSINPLMAYSFTISRVSGLYFLEPDVIIQQIDDGDPWKKEKVNSYLEIWNTNGKKIASKIEIPQWIAGVRERKIYSYAESATKLIKKSDKQATLKVFDVYKLTKVK